MMVMRHILVTLFFLAYAGRAFCELKITSVQIDCGKTELCKSQQERFMSLKESFRNITHLRQTLKVIVTAGGMRDFTWELIPSGEAHALKIFYEPKIPITSIKVESEDSTIQDYIERNSRLRTGQWFEPDMIEDEKIRLLQFLRGKGYPKAEIDYKDKTVKGEIHLTIKVKPHRAQRLLDVIVETESKTLKKFTAQKFQEMYDKPFDIQAMRAKADELELELFGYGYYLTTVGISTQLKDQGVIATLKVTPDELWTFNLVSGPEDVKLEFGPIVKDLFKRYRRPINEETLRSGVQEFLVKSGYLRSNVKLTLNRYKNTLGNWVNQSKVEVIFGKRTRVDAVNFTQGTHWNDKQLHDMWSSQASEQSRSGFYDEESQNNFAQWLQGQYIRAGFVRAQVIGPRSTFSENSSRARLEYAIAEGPRVLVDEITFTGVDEKEQELLLEAIKTKQSAPFNPVQFTEDVKEMANTLQNLGWYYAEVSNRDGDDIVTYSKDRSTVNLKIAITKGKFLTFNRLIIVGNRKTKKIVIERKSPFTEGKPITPAKVREYENALGGLGLFNSVKVRPILHKGDTPLTDLAIDVTERDYGLFEVAPGYRTDLGLKLSSTVSYINIFGENVSTSLTGQINRRLDHQSFDAERKRKKHHLLEYNITAQINVPDVKQTYIDYGLSVSTQRRRFFSFDADIKRIANTISRDFGPHFSAALRHQFESINQFDATEPRDNGSFEIGALTPSVTFDFRNTRINPTAGAWFSVSNEFANPYFLSQKKDDLTINFYKLISRNRFYIPVPRGTIAISLVGGLQENLAKDPLMKDGEQVEQDGVKLTEGYIPNIKLFRLTGTDIVRGFSDQEINRLPNGRDVGEDRVQNKAYMLNFKLEPRYFVNDSFMAGVFYDVGRVYVDSVDISDVRQSVGVTFKVVTPVGTLDFDYGFKLLRKKDENGNLESPGRFHVSIGFF